MIYLYLDESGDLGFDFVNKKPSKFFTITILAVEGSENNKQLAKAVRKTLKRKLNQKKNKGRIVQELKGTGTTLEIKKYFFDLIKDTPFSIYSTTLKKQNFENINIEKSRIYNFIAKKVIDTIEFKNSQDTIYFMIDKSKGKKAIEEFNAQIEEQIKAYINPFVPLNIQHLHSHENFGLQIVDLFAYGTFIKHEHGDSEWFSVFEHKVLKNNILLN